jgi:hypothetical protein
MIAETANMPKRVLALAASRIAIPGAAMGLVVMLAEDDLAMDMLVLTASGVAIPGAAMGLVVVLAEDDLAMDMLVLTASGVAIPGAAMGLVVVLAEEDPDMDMHGTALTMAETVKKVSCGDVVVRMPKRVLALAASRIAISVVVMGLIVVLAEEDPAMDMRGTALPMASKAPCEDVVVRMPKGVLALTTSGLGVSGVAMGYAVIAEKIPNKAPTSNSTSWRICQLNHQLKSCSISDSFSYRMLIIHLNINK